MVLAQHVSICFVFVSVAKYKFNQNTQHISKNKNYTDISAGINSDLNIYLNDNF